MKAPALLVLCLSSFAFGQASPPTAAGGNCSVPSAACTVAALTATTLTVGSLQLDSSGRLFLPNGASGAGTLALSFASDTDTGIYRAGANDLRIQTAGSDRFKIDSSGRITLGNITPTYALDIKGFNGAGNMFMDCDSGGCGFGTSTNQSLKLFANNSTVMTVSTSGDASTVGSLTIGSSNTAAINTSPKNSGALDFGSIAAGTCAELTMSLTGASVDDPVAFSAPAALEANLHPSCRITASGVATFRLCNQQLVTAIDPASGTYAVRAFH